MSSENSYLYQLVQFVRRGPKAPVKSIDCVPSDCVTYNNNGGKLECKFMSPPYDSGKVKRLHDLVKKRVPASAEWPVYTVLIKGSASKHSSIIFIKFQGGH